MIIPGSGGHIDGDINERGRLGNLPVNTDSTRSSGRGCQVDLDVSNSPILENPSDSMNGTPSDNAHLKKLFWLIYHSAPTWKPDEPLKRYDNKNK